MEKLQQKTRTGVYLKAVTSLEVVGDCRMGDKKAQLSRKKETSRLMSFSAP